MPSGFWDYIHIGRTRVPTHDDDDLPNMRNLQEGLFQIATQTCNILVQVNNTNNINVDSSFYSNEKSGNFKDNSKRPSTSTSMSSMKKTTFFDLEQSVILLDSSKKRIIDKSPTKTRFSRLSDYKRRLSTVLESSNRDPTLHGPVGDADDFELWDYSQMLKNQQKYRWNHSSHGIVCKPSCIPIMFILVLIILVVLLPLLDTQHDKLTRTNSTIIGWNCPDECRIQLVESIPEGLVYDEDSPKFMSTFDAWNVLINEAKKTLYIGSFYWTLKSDEVYNHSSSVYGDKIFNSLLNLGTGGKVEIKIAQNMPSQVSPNIDTEILEKRKAAKVRSVNFNKFFGGGVLHTKVWIVDTKHFYVGSANMDWRSLSQVKELGVLVTNCSCLAKDLTKIFNVYWDLGKNDSTIPPKWPDKYTTGINVNKPMIVDYNSGEYLFASYFSSSPQPMNPKGRTHDLKAILNTIETAESFIHISVMDYFPLQIYSPKILYWPDIDVALRKAAIDRRVSVKLLISYWNHSRPFEDNFLRSLTELNAAYKGIDIQVKRFIVPATEDQMKIPFGRVNHNKYMVTDNIAYIGTSNWSGDYFIDTAGIGFVSQDTVHNRNTSEPTLRSQLASIFERDWNSKYAKEQDKFEN